MDWYSSFQKGLVAAQEAAQDAAERAKVLATQASIHAKAYAEQAAEKAKTLAQQAAEEAQQHLAHLQQSAAVASTTKDSSQVAACDLPYFGVTDELLLRVSAMSYSTFSDSPLKGVAEQADFKLSPWQEKHVRLVLERAEQLQNLRFALCPKRMDEQLFWTIYFASVVDLIPPQAASLSDQPPSSVEPSSISAHINSSPTNPGSQKKQDNASIEEDKKLHSEQDTPSKMQQQGSAGGAENSHTSTSSNAAGVSGIESDQWRVASPSGGQITTPRSGVESVVVDVDGLGEDYMDHLDDLEDDPELDAYLQEAMALEDEGGSGDGESEEDLDDYINSLKEEEEDI
ncbi:hypothetical protein CEUSTIGMA_g4821.t1 [Chlamydomonas eustigma]|uniref:BSD domain-containing protein n=1 Tax=Chlamydomonas eustigma TaxID=1157962 RepID=A0A250X2U5_9CHLO|nr:hypothetical protein CEUSTIGMA_g4821.t1 [Chlamydomonas eustigma]|eukprot:GAX77375.1 hypothetical protein CEUSTIGMA_g4821.t1 [Chlamydomonas eustigma]